jgi:hypothetical protein
LMAERRAAAPCAPRAAERTQHNWTLLYNRRRNRQSSSERTLQSPVVAVEQVVLYE